MPKPAIKFEALARRYISPTPKYAGPLRLVFDVESDGLLDTATKAHCVAIADLDSDQVDAYGPTQIEEALAHLSRAACLVGHNVLGFDLPLLLRTLRLGAVIRHSRYADQHLLILPNVGEIDNQIVAMGGASLGKLRGRYSLEAWGLRLGIPKIGAEITDWSTWTPEMQARLMSRSQGAFSFPAA